MLLVCEHEAQGVGESYRQPRAMETGIPKKRVPCQCFICDSKYLALGSQQFNSKIMLKSNAVL